MTLIFLIILLLVAFLFTSKQNFSDYQTKHMTSMFQVETDSLNISPDYPLWNNFDKSPPFIF